MLFIKRLMAFLISLGIDLAEVIFNIDNSTEYVSNSPDLNRVSLFEEVIAISGTKLVRIQPRACTYQSEVEQANGIIEDELLDVYRFQNKAELVAKTTAWEYYFNSLRPKSYHRNQYPYQRMKKAGVGIIEEPSPKLQEPKNKT